MERRYPTLLLQHSPVNGKALLVLGKRTSSKSPPPAAPLQTSSKARQTIQKASKEEEPFSCVLGWNSNIRAPATLRYELRQGCRNRA